MKIIMTLLATGVLTLAPGAAMAVSPQTSSPPQSGSISPSHVTGQPDQSCEDLGNRPGQSIDSPGSAFSPTGTSGGKYAGQQTGINDKNTAASSQYDVACLHNQSPD
jgi:hypothetical protein